ncbi:hypothetical protein EG68_01942 [Paragonimus skrjabini miyazakii]|uniref:Uncharacterized protein n=1 Tax=Paragonimus skrjabini miyazakii TaxID=59628 RepID=A0A8S9Z5Z5_9TREM|nr:hypothetical protein EG68_01942 [Paragonimus skrjabini miyazakii]
MNPRTIVPPEPLDVNSTNRLEDNCCLWREKYEDFCLLANLTETSIAYQLAMPRHAAGDGGRRILGNVTFKDGEDKKEPSVIIRKVEEYCLGQTNKTFERFQFFERNR